MTHETMLHEAAACYFVYYSLTVKEHMFDLLQV